LPEERVLAVGEKISGIQCGMNNLRDSIVVGTLFYDENRQRRVSFSESSGDYASSETACEIV